MEEKYRELSADYYKRKFVYTSKLDVHIKENNIFSKKD